MTMALLCAMCVAAFADKEIYKGGLLCHCFDATMTAEVRISDYHDTYEMDVVVPETVEIDGKIYTVTSIGEYTFTYALHSISLPNHAELHCRIQLLRQSVARLTDLTRPAAACGRTRHIRRVGSHGVCHALRTRRVARCLQVG